ncbi:MAG TPA: helix-turn-helix domain-containing protein [Solirubrobacteraceae bacterium]|nr:helix-turn-helix domain-containing protein [Solirubrobacteraceae bacterium]
MSTPIITPRSAARIAGMARVAPEPDLTDVVEQHWIVSWDQSGRPALRREVLPDPSINLVVEPDGPLLYGVGSGRSVRELTGRGMVIGTKFRPGGFSGFRPGSVSELTGRVMTLREAFGPGGGQLDEELAAASDIATILAAVSEFLRRRRPPPDPQRALVMDVLHAMRSSPPGTRVGELAAAFALTPRTLQRIFARHVGASPKQVLQRLRRQRAVDELSQGRAPDLARLAADLGYFDQAHLAQDFRTTLRRSPSAVATGGSSAPHLAATGGTGTPVSQTGTVPKKKNRSPQKAGSNLPARDHVPGLISDRGAGTRASG